MYSITRRDLNHAHYASHSALGTLKAFEEKHLTRNVGNTIWSGVTALGFGFLSGYAGAIDVWRVPVDFLAGVLLQFGAAFKVLGNKSHILQAMGSGAFDAGATKWGAAMGDAVRRKQGRHIVRGAFPTASGASVLMGAERRPVTEAEMMRMASAVRS
jgi:hypothetical protein